MEKVGVWKMSIFVVSSSYINVDAGDYAHEILGAFETFDSAQKVFEQAIKDTRCDFSGEDYEETEYAEGDMAYAIWVPEYEMSYRCEIKITEMEIK